MTRLRGLRIRFASARDPYSAARRDWMQSLGLPFDEDDLSRKIEIVLSTATVDYDVLIFGCEDVARLTSYVEVSRDILRHKIAFPLMGRSTAHRRAMLLKAGFDDVFDISKTPPLEGLARIYAVWNRCRSAKLRWAIEDAKEQMLERVAPISRLTISQRNVIECLIKSGDMGASYAHLMSIYYDNDEISFDHLKVVICNLRKLLNPGYQIKSGRNGRYYLKKFHDI